MRKAGGIRGQIAKTKSTPKPGKVGKVVSSTKPPAKTKPTSKPATKPATKAKSRAKPKLTQIALETAKLWRKHHLDYDQTKHLVEQVRKALKLSAPKERRRTVERLDRDEIEALIQAAYKLSSKYGLMVKTLFYTGARVSEFVNIGVQDLHLGLKPAQVEITHAKMGSDGYVPIMPALAQELRTHLGSRRSGFVFETNRFDQFSPRMVQLIVRRAARAAGIEKQVTPHRLRTSVATILLDAGMPIDQVQKFLRHKNVSTTQIYAATSISSMGENYVRAFKNEG